MIFLKVAFDIFVDFCQSGVQIKENPSLAALIKLRLITPIFLTRKAFMVVVMSDVG